MATEAQRQRDAAQKRNARRIRSGQPVPRASGLSPEAVRGYRERAAQRATAKQQGSPPPPPLKPSRVPVSPDWIAYDRSVIQGRQGGYAPNGEWISPRLEGPEGYSGFLPRSEVEYQPEEGEVVYDKNSLFPKYNYKREQKESKIFNRQDQDQGDFIPLTYYPTKTSWPGNGFDHRRTIAAGYSRSKGVIRVQFYTDGSIYDYGINTPIPPMVAYQFRLTQSPGRAIHGGPGWGGSSLESYGYERIG